MDLNSGNHGMNTLVLVTGILVADFILYVIFQGVHVPKAWVSVFYWKIAIVYVLVKFIFGYYILLFLYFYFFSEPSFGFSVWRTLVVVLLVFFLCVTSFTVLGGSSTVGVYYGLLIKSIRFPLGNEFYIMIFTSLASPFITRFVLRILNLA